MQALRLLKLHKSQLNLRVDNNLLKSIAARMDVCSEIPQLSSLLHSEF